MKACQRAPDVLSFRLPPSSFKWAGVAQLVEHQPSKLRVASSSLVARSSFLSKASDSRPRSSGVERLLGKEEVMSSNLIAGSIYAGSQVSDR